MLFKFNNASVMFQFYINKVLAFYLNVFYIIYLNDILIYFKTEEEHINYIKRVLQYFRNYQLYIKLSKYKSYIKKIDFIKYIVISDNTEMKFN